MTEKNKNCSGEKKMETVAGWGNTALCFYSRLHQHLNMTSYSPRTKDRGHDLHWTSRLVHHISTQISTQWHPVIFIITALLGYKIPLMAQRCGHICNEVWSEVREGGKKGVTADAHESLHHDCPPFLFLPVQCLAKAALVKADRRQSRPLII